MRTEIENIPEGLPPGIYDVEFAQFTQDEDGEPVVRLRFKPQSPPEPEKAYLLVEVDKSYNQERLQRYILEASDGVLAIYDHGKGCCCKNCPWDGNHGE